MIEFPKLFMKFKSIFMVTIKSAKKDQNIHNFIFL